MKKTFKFFAAALAIVAAASCAKEANVDTTVDDSAEKVEVIVTASYDEEVDTRSMLAPDGGSVYWSDDDGICVYRYYDGAFQSFSKLTIDPASINKTFAAFTGSLTYKKSHLYYATFPGEGWDSSYMRFNTGLAKQNAVKDSFDPKKHLALADKAKNDTYDHYVFHNACALLKICVNRDNVFSIKVEGENNNLGIGQKVRFSAGSLAVTQLENTYNSANNAITLSNADGSALENGASYYIVVPHIKVKNFKVAMCDANGTELVSKSKGSDFVIERNKIYDLGTLDGSTPAEVLEVDKSSMSFTYEKASATITIKSNVAWNVASNQSWLTVDKSSGSATDGTTITVNVAANKDNTDRTAQITITGKEKTSLILVTQGAAPAEPTYELGQIVYPNDMRSGGKYVILLRGYVHTDTVKNKYLKARSDGKLLSAAIADNNLKPHIFVFNKTGETDNAQSGYSQIVVGTFTSLLIGKNLGLPGSDGIMYFNEGEACEMTIGNNNYAHSDIKKKGTNEYLHLNDKNEVMFGTEGWRGYWGQKTEGNNTSQVWVSPEENRQWYIYEVIEK